MRYLVFLLCLFQAGNALAVASYADLVEQLMPSVVNISTEKEIIETNENIDNFMIEPQLSGREALGSGFFIRDDGHILTNAHVISGAKRITVITNDNKSYMAKVIGTDSPSDLAVLKITPEEKAKFVPVAFGNADKARIGDIVITFGNPYGLGVSVSQGIISAKSRNIGLSELPYLQTDAAINQGNSGGPMFDIDGRVIGVNSAIFKTSGASGVGFALPSNIANWISNQLIANGKVRRGWLGMSVAYGIDKYTDKSGFVVTEINEESNAYKEGIRVGDIIIAYNDKTADDLTDFKQFTETMEIGQALRLKVLNYGEEVRHVIRIQDMPSTALQDVVNKALKESAQYYFNNTDNGTFYVSELRAALKEATPRGLMITKLDKGSPLNGKGIKSGDIILEADKADIYSVDNLLEVVRNATLDDSRPITLLIQGVENTFYITTEMAAEYD